MRSFVYKSIRKADAYLYLREEGAFELIPADLLEILGPPVFVIELLLDPDRQLAREDVNVVMRNLTEQGYHLQVPPPPGVIDRS